MNGRPGGEEVGLQVCLLLCLALGLAGCQSCDERAKNQPPPMPTGMLVPMEGGGTDAPEPLAARLRSSTQKKPTWFGVASGKGTRWVSVTAFSLMENSFARAEPGFGPFGKREVSATNAPKLATELKTLREEWMALGSIEAAREKFPDGLSTNATTGVAWPEVQEAFGTTLAEIAGLAEGGSAVTVSTP